jgi:enoyl-CoA hydratase/carnithine racemase
MESNGRIAVNSRCSQSEVKPMSDTVLCEVRDSVALLTLNRPDKLNALNYELIDRLVELLDGIERDKAIRIVIMTEPDGRFRPAPTLRALRRACAKGRRLRCAISCDAASG